MTTEQLYLFSGLYIVALLAVAFFTRATMRRIGGALAGAAVFSAVALAADALGEKLGWWRMTIWETPILPVVYLCFVVSITPIYLVTWRVTRRFGWRGLAVAVVLLTVIGPPRDYAYVASFPEWGNYAPGIAPVLAIAGIYAVMVPLGHAVMRQVAGPPGTDRLLRRPWETT